MPRARRKGTSRLPSSSNLPSFPHSSGDFFSDLRAFRPMLFQSRNTDVLLSRKSNLSQVTPTRDCSMASIGLALGNGPRPRFIGHFDSDPSAASLDDFRRNHTSQVQTLRLLPPGWFVRTRSSSSPWIDDSGRLYA